MTAILRIAALAFIGGCILASCGKTPTGPRCTVASVDTIWIHNADRTDSLPAIITVEWCKG
jgi:hypothetical protein